MIHAIETPNKNLYLVSTVNQENFREIVQKYLRHNIVSDSFLKEAIKFTNLQKENPKKLKYNFRDDKLKNFISSSVYSSCIEIYKILYESKQVVPCSFLHDLVEFQNIFENVMLNMMRIEKLQPFGGIKFKDFLELLRNEVYRYVLSDYIYCIVRIILQKYWPNANYYFEYAVLLRFYSNVVGDTKFSSNMGDFNDLYIIFGLGKSLNYTQNIFYENFLSMKSMFSNAFYQIKELLNEDSTNTQNYFAKEKKFIESDCSEYTKDEIISFTQTPPSPKSKYSADEKESLCINNEFILKSTDQPKTHVGFENKQYPIFKENSEDQQKSNKNALKIALASKTFLFPNFSDLNFSKNDGQISDQNIQQLFSKNLEKDIFQNSEILMLQRFDKLFRQHFVTNKYDISLKSSWEDFNECFQYLIKNLNKCFEEDDPSDSKNKEKINTSQYKTFFTNLFFSEKETNGKSFTQNGSEKKIWIFDTSCQLLNESSRYFFEKEFSMNYFAEKLLSLYENTKEFIFSDKICIFLYKNNSFWFSMNSKLININGCDNSSKSQDDSSKTYQYNIKKNEKSENKKRNQNLKGIKKSEINQDFFPMYDQKTNGREDNISLKTEELLEKNMKGTILIYSPLNYELYNILKFQEKFLGDYTIDFKIFEMTFKMMNKSLDKSLMNLFSKKMYCDSYCYPPTNVHLYCPNDAKIPWDFQDYFSDEILKIFQKPECLFKCAVLLDNFSKTHSRFLYRSCFPSKTFDDMVLLFFKSYFSQEFLKKIFYFFPTISSNNKSSIQLETSSQKNNVSNSKKAVFVTTKANDKHLQSLTEFISQSTTYKRKSSGINLDNTKNKFPISDCNTTCKENFICHEIKNEKEDIKVASICSDDSLSDINEIDRKLHNDTSSLKKEDLESIRGKNTFFKENMYKNVELKPISTGDGTIYTNGKVIDSESDNPKSPVSHKRISDSEYNRIIIPVATTDLEDDDILFNDEHVFDTKESVINVQPKISNSRYSDSVHEDVKVIKSRDSNLNKPTEISCEPGIECNSFENLEEHNRSIFPLVQNNANGSHKFNNDTSKSPKTLDKKYDDAKIIKPAETKSSSPKNEEDQVSSSINHNKLSTHRKNRAKNNNKYKKKHIKLTTKADTKATSNICEMERGEHKTSETIDFQCKNHGDRIVVYSNPSMQSEKKTEPAEGVFKNSNNTSENQDLNTHKNNIDDLCTVTKPKPSSLVENSTTNTQNDLSNLIAKYESKIKDSKMKVIKDRNLPGQSSYSSKNTYRFIPKIVGSENLKIANFQTISIKKPVIRETSAIVIEKPPGSSSQFIECKSSDQKSSEHDESKNKFPDYNSVSENLSNVNIHEQKCNEQFTPVSDSLNTVDQIFRHFSQEKHKPDLILGAIEKKSQKGPSSTQNGQGLSSLSSEQIILNKNSAQSSIPSIEHNIAIPISTNNINPQETIIDEQISKKHAPPIASVKNNFTRNQHQVKLSNKTYRPHQILSDIDQGILKSNFEKDKTIENAGHVQKTTDLETTLVQEDITVNESPISKVKIPKKTKNGPNIGAQRQGIEHKTNDDSISGSEPNSATSTSSLQTEQSEISVNPIHAHPLVLNTAVNTLGIEKDQQTKDYSEHTEQPFNLEGDLQEHQSTHLIHIKESKYKRKNTVQKKQHSSMFKTNPHPTNTLGKTTTPKTLTNIGADKNNDIHRSHSPNSISSIASSKNQNVKYSGVFYPKYRRNLDTSVFAPELLKNENHSRGSSLFPDRSNFPTIVNHHSYTDSKSYPSTSRFETTTALCIDGESFKRDSSQKEIHQDVRKTPWLHPTRPPSLGYLEKSIDNIKKELKGLKDGSTEKVNAQISHSSLDAIIEKIEDFQEDYNQRTKIYKERCLYGHDSISNNTSPYRSNLSISEISSSNTVSNYGLPYSLTPIEVSQLKKNSNITNSSNGTLNSISSAESSMKSLFNDILKVFSKHFTQSSTDNSQLVGEEKPNQNSEKENIFDPPNLCVSDLHKTELELLEKSFQDVMKNIFTSGSDCDSTPGYSRVKHNESSEKYDNRAKIQSFKTSIDEIFYSLVKSFIDHESVTKKLSFEEKKDLIDLIIEKNHQEFKNKIFAEMDGFDMDFFAKLDDIYSNFRPKSTINEAEPADLSQETSLSLIKNHENHSNSLTCDLNLSENNLIPSKDTSHKNIDALDQPTNSDSNINQRSTKFFNISTQPNHSSSDLSISTNTYASKVNFDGKNIPDNPHVVIEIDTLDVDQPNPSQIAEVDSKESNLQLVANNQIHPSEIHNQSLLPLYSINNQHENNHSIINVALPIYADHNIPYPMVIIPTRFLNEYGCFDPFRHIGLQDIQHNTSEIQNQSQEQNPMTTYNENAQFSANNDIESRQSCFVEPISMEMDRNSEYDKFQNIPIDHQTKYFGSYHHQDPLRYNFPLEQCFPSEMQHPNFVYSGFTNTNNSNDSLYNRPGENIHNHHNTSIFSPNPDYTRINNHSMHYRYFPPSN